jgi:predicted DNA-binding protein (MmcQ/YjbR family)
MDIEAVRAYCLSLPEATEDFPFDETTLVFRLHNKIFACLDFERTEWLTLKCDPDYAIDLRDRYSGIEPAWHWNKKYWNQVSLHHCQPQLICSLIRHSYNEVIKKLPKKLQATLCRQAE